MPKLGRRQFIQTSLLGAASLGQTMEVSAYEFHQPQGDGVIIDTNVDVLGWPFRDLKYGKISDLVRKLRKHKVKEAWAGSYEALFHKNIDGVNARLAKACREKGEGLLVPFGAVNPAWPDWEEDLRRVDEVYGMPGIKLYPSYQNYGLGDPAIEELIRRATERGLTVLIAVDMEDERVHHPRLDITAADVSRLTNVLEQVPEAQVVLVNAFRHVRGELLKVMLDYSNLMFDISRLDGTGAIRELLDGSRWGLDGPVSANRLVFGSHAPFFPIENALFKFMESPMTEAEAAAIMHENAAKLSVRS